MKLALRLHRSMGSIRTALLPALLMALLVLAIPAQSNAGQIFLFDTDPFEGTDALTTPGRQIVGNELFVEFDIATDVFALLPEAFGFTGGIQFFNGLAGDIPTGNVNMIVLGTTDNDNNLATPFGAGTAANLIAEAITESAPGFFIYHNSNLQMNRLVFSTDLSDPTADLKILARITNLTGLQAVNALPTFSEANFSTESVGAVPEPGTMSLLFGSGLVLAAFRWRTRAQANRPTA